jgi:hypothetical protein
MIDLGLRIGGGRLLGEMKRERFSYANTFR